MIIDKKIVGEKIRQLRKEKGFSQEELSEKIDISPRHMCTIENGNSIPSLETFVKIAEILRLDVNKFFNLEFDEENSVRTEIYDLVQLSTPKELVLIKNIIVSIHENRD